MYQHKIYLSMGVVPWLGIKQALHFARECGFDGIEFLPTRKAVRELNTNFDSYRDDFRSIEHAHHSWRLDMGHDTSYGIDLLSSVFFSLLRLIFFPNNTESKKILTRVSDEFGIDVTVHSLSSEWTKDSNNREFKGGIGFEILEEKKVGKDELQKWLTDKNHTVVVDTRDDQSLRFAKYHGFGDFADFWTWLGIAKIKNVQLTLIGNDGIKKILNHKPTRAEKEFLWLNSKNWKGSVTVEVNPFILFLITFGNLKKGLKHIVRFVQTSLD